MLGAVMRTTTILTALGTACATLLLTAGPAAAVPPDASVFPLTFAGTTTGTTTVPAAGVDGYCAFPVRLDVVNDQRFVSTPAVPLPGDTVTTRNAGAAFVTAVNLLTGESVRYNISGPGTTVTAPDGSFSTDATGTQLSLTTVENSAAGVSPLSFTTGRVRFSVDAAGMTTSYQLSGRARDVCEELG
jgi:hypothetical protein